MIVNTLTVVLSFLFVLTVVVALHEFGHYLMAKFFGTRVERFSIGFGKPLFQRKLANGETWAIARWPLGGFVQFAGDANPASAPLNKSDRDAASDQDTSGYFNEKPLWQRALIVAAGPAMNFVLAAVVFAILAWTVGEVRRSPVIFQVSPGSVAEQAGFRAGDRFVSIDGRAMESTTDVQTYVGLRADEPMSFVLERGGREIFLDATPARVLRQDAVGGMTELGTLGVGLGSREDIERIEYGPLQAIGRGAERVAESVAMTGQYAKRLVTGKEDGKALGGVVRIAAVTGKVAVDAKNGYGAPEVSFPERARAVTLILLSLMAAISVALGIANLLPIPMLDGGHLAFYAYEAVARKPLSPQVQDVAHRVGLAFLLGAFVLLTLHDVGYVRSLLSSS